MLREAQMRRVKPCFPFLHGILRVYERQIATGIIFVSWNGLVGARSRSLWPAQYDLPPADPLERLGVLDRIFAELTARVVSRIG